MPRRKNVASAFRQVQQQARMLVANLQKEIRAKEMELKQLKQEEASLGQLTGRVARASTAGGGNGRVSGRVGRGRINWRAVLDQLPKQFKAAHIRDIRGLKGKRPSEIFAAITRWIDAGTVKRKARGVYERV
jgi:translation initiation factor 2B subunit (eIF-2B alpha/beta/delta family)